MTDNKHIQQKIEDRLTRLTNQEPAEQILAAQQIISEIGTINSHEAFAQVQKRIQKRKNTISLLNTFSRIAAILFIPLLLASVWLFYNQQKPVHQQFAIQEITSPPGIRSQVVRKFGSMPKAPLSFRFRFRKTAETSTLLVKPFLM